MRAVLALPLLLLLAGCATVPPSDDAVLEVSPHGSSTISGSVWNLADHYFADDADVFLEAETGETFYVRTDGRGRFRFEGLGPGTYTVQIYAGIGVSEVVSLGASQGVQLKVEVHPRICFFPARARGSLFSLSSTEAEYLDQPRTLRH